MNISSQRLDALIDDFPDERETIVRLRDLFAADASREMTLDHLILRLNPRSVPKLAHALEILASEGLVSRVYRLESRKARASIQDYAQFIDIPVRVHDWHSDTEFEVTPADLKVVYKIP